VKVDVSDHAPYVRLLFPCSLTVLFQIFLDRMTAETIARFLEPFTRRKEEDFNEPKAWIEKLTTEMEVLTKSQIQVAPVDIQSTIHSANSGRIYFEQLHLHPVRLTFTFTQEWMEWNPSSQSTMLVQFIRGMVRDSTAIVSVLFVGCC
jgi:hypothetical protein